MATVKTISKENLQQRINQGDSLYSWNVLADGYFNCEMIQDHVVCPSTASDTSI